MLKESSFDNFEQQNVIFMSGSFKKIATSLKMMSTELKTSKVDLLKLKRLFFFFDDFFFAYFKLKT
jgi:hypothetical protein